MKSRNYYVSRAIALGLESVPIEYREEVTKEVMHRTAAMSTDERESIEILINAEFLTTSEAYRLMFTDRVFYGLADPVQKVLLVNRTRFRKYKMKANVENMKVRITLSGAFEELMPERYRYIKKKK